MLHIHDYSLSLFGVFAQIMCAYCVYWLLVPKSAARENVVIRMQEHPVTSAILFACCLLCCAIFNPNFYRLIEKDDVRTMPNGEYCYYVEVNREFDNSTYTLPAKIDIHRSDSGYMAYYLRNVYFNNGGYLDLGWDEEIELNKTFTFIDQNDELWEGTFTNKRCTPSPFAESNDAPVLYTVLLFFDVLVLVLTYISLQISVQNTKKEEKENR